MCKPIPASHLDLITRPIHGVLTTMMPDGQPQSSLVWCDYDGQCACVNTTLERQKRLRGKSPDGLGGLLGLLLETGSKGPEVRFRHKAHQTLGRTEELHTFDVQLVFQKGQEGAVEGHSARGNGIHLPKGLADTDLDFFPGGPP